MWFGTTVYYCVLLWSLLETQFNLKQWCGATPPSQMALFTAHMSRGENYICEPSSMNRTQHSNVYFLLARGRKNFASSTCEPSTFDQTAFLQPHPSHLYYDISV